MAPLPIFTRVQPIYSVLLPTLFSIILILLRDWNSLASFRRNIQNYRSASSLIVQIISSGLGGLQTLTATSLLEAATRVYLLERSAEIEDVHLWTTLLAPCIDTSFRKWRLVAVVVFFLIAQIPAALWAGALTPVFMTATLTTGSIQVPAYTTATEDIWNNEFQVRGPKVFNVQTSCTKINSAGGYMASCPVPDMQAPRDHSKNDNPDWIYRGRSYGVGSSQGLSSISSLPSGSRLEAYNYTEIGYIATVDCYHNSSSEYYFNPDNNATDVTVWHVDGYLPNSAPENPEKYPVLSWSTGPGSVGILNWSAVVNDNRNMIAIAAGDHCSVAFALSNFTVTVNTIAQSILVNPQFAASHLLTDIEPSGRLIANAMYSVRLLSFMSTSLYVSVLGETLFRNIETLRARHSNDTPTADSPSVANAAVAESFAAILDDVLVAYGAAQLVLANASSTVPVTGVYQAVRIGQNTYIYATLAVNILLLLAVVVEMVRTWLWLRLPDFEYSNITSVIIAASAGGIGLADEVTRREEMGRAPGKTIEGEGTAVRIRVRAKRGKRVAIVVAKEGDGSRRGRRREGGEELEMSLLEHEE
ncbi:hypothetical protein MMC18_002250 [Xylographa bjoerkii]|nr:hypothetical protein [Xylographa bjoerkii]